MVVRTEWVSESRLASLDLWFEAQLIPGCVDVRGNDLYVKIDADLCTVQEKKDKLIAQGLNEQDLSAEQALGLFGRVVKGWCCEMSGFVNTLTII